MKWSAQKESEWRWFGWAAFLTIAALLAMVGCASAGPPEYLTDARACVDAEPCVVIQVKNDRFEDASVWINNSRKGTINGFGSLTLFLRQSELTEGGRCVIASFRLIGDHSVHGTSKECLQEREGHFTLHLDPLGNAWLTPWLR